MPVAALVAALIQTSPTTIEDLSWISGYWLSCSGANEVSETWSDPRDGLMAGVTLTVRGSGRGSVEFTRIAPVGEGVVFLAQPGGVAPIAFSLVTATPNRAVFENLDHDFPQRVIYSRDGDTLTGRIEGTADGQARSMAWTYRAAPLNSRCPD